MGVRPNPSRVLSAAMNERRELLPSVAFLRCGSRDFSLPSLHGNGGRRGHGLVTGGTRSVAPDMSTAGVGLVTT